MLTLKSLENLRSSLTSCDSIEIAINELNSFFTTILPASTGESAVSDAVSEISDGYNKKTKYGKLANTICTECGLNLTKEFTSMHAKNKIRYALLFVFMSLFYIRLSLENEPDFKQTNTQASHSLQLTLALLCLQSISFFERTIPKLPNLDSCSLLQPILKCDEKSNASKTITNGSGRSRRFSFSNNNNLLNLKQKLIGILSPACKEFIQQNEVKKSFAESVRLIFDIKYASDRLGLFTEEYLNQRKELAKSQETVLEPRHLPERPPVKDILQETKSATIDEKNGSSTNCELR